MVIFYAVLNGYFSGLETKDVKNAETGLIEYVEKFHEKDILDRLSKGSELDAQTEEKLKQAIGKFMEGFSH